MCPLSKRKPLSQYVKSNLCRQLVQKCFCILANILFGCVCVGVCFISEIHRQFKHSKCILEKEWTIHPYNRGLRQFNAAALQHKGPGFSSQGGETLPASERVSSGRYGFPASHQNNMSRLISSRCPEPTAVLKVWIPGSCSVAPQERRMVHIRRTYFSARNYAYLS